MIQTDIYQMITDKMVEQLEKGIIPWHQPWSNSGLMAISHTNGRPYSMLNQFLLDMISGEWLTFNQIKEEGGTIRKGEKSHFVVFWKFIEKKEKNDDGEETIVKNIPVLRYYNVWNISQCEGIEPKYAKASEETLSPIDECEHIIKTYGERENLPIMREMSCDSAFYSPKKDNIVVPKIGQFGVIEEYYSTLFHEMTHSTGAANRLNREGIVKFDHFGSEQYSKEELIAELGASFLCNLSGLDTTKCFNNSVAYIQSWLKELKNDKKMVVSASSKAEQAAKFIMTGERPSFA